MLLFAATVFLSAFLLFQVQPIVAKMILPWFGGSSSVWTLCMVFFQVELLLGYAYVHWVHEKLRPQRQRALLLPGLQGNLRQPAALRTRHAAGLRHPRWPLPEARRPAARLQELRQQQRQRPLPVTVRRPVAG